MPVERVCAMAKILVIDDEFGILDLVDDVLHRKGHDVVLAEDGRTGLRLFQQERPHVTILDFNMPDVGGLAVLRKIRTLDPNALVIMLTGFGTEERERQALLLGAAEFLDKSLVLHTLGATLDRVLTQIGRTMMTGERRQFPRFLVQFPVSFIRNGVMIGEGTGCDLSAGGCTVASRADVRTGDHVELQLYLLDHQEPTTPLMVEIAEVRWTIQQQCGLEFLSLPSGDKKRLLQYVETLETTSP
jgi:DNA-binding response OmpR family regulator